MFWLMQPVRLRQPNHGPRAVVNIVVVWKDKVLLGVRKNPALLADPSTDVSFLHAGVLSSPTLTFADEFIRLFPILPRHGSETTIPRLPPAPLNQGNLSKRRLSSMLTTYVLGRTCNPAFLTDGHTIMGETQMIHVKHGYVPEVDGGGQLDWTRGDDHAMLTVLVRIDAGAERFVGDTSAYDGLDWFPIPNVLARASGETDSLRSANGQIVGNYLGGFCIDSLVKVLEFARRDPRTVLSRALGAPALEPKAEVESRFSDCKAVILGNIDGVGGILDRMFAHTSAAWKRDHGNLEITDERGKAERSRIRRAFAPFHRGFDLVPDLEVAQVQDCLERRGVDLVTRDPGLVTPVTALDQLLAIADSKRLGVFTENSRPMAETLLAALDIRPHSLCTRNEVPLGHETSLVAMLRRVCEELDVAPDEAVVVGRTARALDAVSQLGAHTISIGEVVENRSIGLRVGTFDRLHLEPTGATFSIGIV